MTDTLATLAHEINQSIYNTANGSRLAPTFLGCYDLNLGVLTYINAGGQPARTTGGPCHRYRRRQRHGSPVKRQKQKWIRSIARIYKAEYAPLLDRRRISARL